MLYRLRTLMVLLGLGPIVLAGMWMAMSGDSASPVLLAAVIYVVLALVLLAVSAAFEAFGTPWMVRLCLSRWRRAGICSYCGQSRLPLAEGMAGVLICRDCAKGCVAILDQEPTNVEPAAGEMRNP